jgi:nucleoside-diphosphate-sugar epimerase
MAKLIFGCGYLGLRVGRLWRERGERVFAVTRSLARAQEIAQGGIEPLVGDLTGPAQLAIPEGVGTVLFAVGYDRDSSRSIREVYVGGLERAIAALPRSIRRFVYISTTGVYGHVTGGEVDEDAPCQPTRAGGIASLEAERVLAGGPLANRAIVLRMAGLYGPGRIPRSRDLAEGKPIDAPADGWLNLIHVDDAARIVLLAEERAPVPRTYVVSDGSPVVRGEYYRELARLLGAPPPQFIAPPADSPAAQRAASDKRVAPRCLFRELEPRLMFPTYRHGLASIVGSLEGR